MSASTYNFFIRLHVLLVVLLFLCCLTLARPLNSLGSDGRPKEGNMAGLENSNAMEVSGTEWSIKEGKGSGDGRILENSVMDYDYGEANQRHEPTKGNTKWGGGGGKRPPTKPAREP